MTLLPYTVARYGMYAALMVAIGSMILGYRAGASLDYVILRGVIVFVVFAALAIAAEGILIWAPDGGDGGTSTPKETTNE